MLSLHGDKPEVVDNREISAPSAVKELGGLSLGAGEPTSHEGLRLVVVRHGIPTITNAAAKFSVQAASRIIKNQTTPPLRHRQQARQHRFLASL